MKDAPNSKRTFEQDNSSKRVKKELAGFRKIGSNAAKHGSCRYTKEQLMEYNKYSPLQADAYLEGYDKDAGKFSAEELKMNKAIYLAGRARKSGRNPRSIDDLKEKSGFNQAQIEAYYAAFDKESVSDTYLIKRAQNSGRDAAKNRRPRKTEKQLMEDINYSQAQAQAYLKVYDKYCLTTSSVNPRPTGVGIMRPALVLPAPQTNAPDTIEMEEILLMTTPPNRLRR